MRLIPKTMSLRFYRRRKRKSNVLLHVAISSPSRVSPTRSRKPLARRSARSTLQITRLMLPATLLMRLNRQLQLTTGATPLLPRPAVISRMPLLQRLLHVLRMNRMRRISDRREPALMKTWTAFSPRKTATRVVILWQEGSLFRLRRGGSFLFPFASVVTAEGSYVWSSRRIPFALFDCWGSTGHGSHSMVWILGFWFTYKQCIFLPFQLSPFISIL